MSTSSQKDSFRIDLANLPLILAGPILRRTEPDSVTVWLALKESRSVSLKVYKTANGRGSIIEDLILAGSRTTVAVGNHLHIVAVTAITVNNELLEPSQIYAYDLDFGGTERTLPQALNLSGIFPYTTVSYFEHNLPTFAMPPDDLNHLKIVHGSCRKPHGGGKDALPLLDYFIEHFASEPHSRPQQLFLTGDQIYGDDVADPMLWKASQVGDVLLGWEEKLPLANEDYKTPSQLKPGERTEIAEKFAGLTAMLYDKPDKAKSHLFSLGEYYAAYLLAWSPVFWGNTFPDGQAIHQDPKKVKYWEKEAKEIAEFASELWKVRRAIANVSTYTICDDHDVTDDWYLNREWCHRVLSKPLGRRVVQNAMLAYAIFQAWGNTPEQFTNEETGEKLLQAAEKWSISRGTDKVIEAQITKYLGIPPIDLQTGLPKQKLDENVWILDRDDADRTKLIQWHYTIRSFRHEVIMLDTRNWRGYPQGKTTDPPMLLCPTAFHEQLEKPFAETDFLKQKQGRKIEASFVVVPTNLVSLSVIDKFQSLDLERDRVFNSDVGDSWNFNNVAFSKLLATLFARRSRVIILSGDIHFGCAVRLNYWASSQANSKVLDRPGILVQLTSSAFKNGELTTYFAHTKVKSILPEQSTTWAGWHEPPELVEMITTPERVRMQKVEVPSQGPILRQIVSPQGNWEMSWKVEVSDWRSLPDWEYQIQWIKRQPAQVVPWGKRHPSSPNQQQPISLQILKNSVSWLWRNRWLQEGEEIVGHNNFSVVSFQWSENDDTKAVIQDIYWHPIWQPSSTVYSRYFVPLNMPTSSPQLQIVNRDRVTQSRD
ncbi:PhoD-like phosphatase [Oscillatoria salina]|uniref:PhoD-like phosphatase n=1 Tax=Oscillatoria salina TaxID=331517 RepID=UPI001CCA323D|nr:PhoD-like phosphatase [Oscillatoria salina]MBZ8180733.1 PhoD-like phosphatase [Oscillatoria salina IIICB1]